jgi:hypothetical protein
MANVKKRYGELNGGKPASAYPRSFGPNLGPWSTTRILRILGGSTLRGGASVSVDDIEEALATTRWFVLRHLSTL